MQVQDGLEALRYSEETLKHLNSFQNDKTITPELEKCLETITLTGLICYPWKLIQELLVTKLEQVLDGYINEGTQPPKNKLKAEIGQAIRKFDNPPFTIQRMCELLTKSHDYCSTCDKFVFAFEKMVSVTTVESVLDPEVYNEKVSEFYKKMKEVKKEEKRFVIKEVKLTQIRVESMDVESDANM